MTELTPETLTEWREDAEPALKWGDSRNRSRILALIDALEAERTRVERVRALAEEWEASADTWGTCSHEWADLRKLRDALGGGDQ